MEKKRKEKLLIWNEIKKAAPAIMRAGGNAVEILIWSQDKTLDEVIMFLTGNESLETFKNRKHNFICDTNEENHKERSKRKNKVYLDDQEEDEDDYQTQERRLSNIFDIKHSKEIMEQTKKIRELVEFEENSLTKNEKFVLGLMEDE